jgi:hypothetical protein
LAVDGDLVGQRSGDHRSPRVVFTGAIQSRRPVIATTVLPAIRFQHGFIQLVVDLAEDGDEVLVVDLLFLGGERLAAAELFEHVVKCR